MRKKAGLIIAFVLFMTFVLSGCGDSGKQAENMAANAADNDFKIVTSFYPMYIATVNVTKNIDGVTVENMTKPQTGCLHDYQLTTEDLKMLEKADVFVVNGAGMESFIDKAVSQQPKLMVVEASRGIDMLSNSEGVNPHVWVSVTEAIKQVQNIADQLAEIDVKNGEKYQQNAAVYINKLEKLKADMHSALDGLENRKVITFHEAFPYFAKEFNLDIVTVIEREPGSEPTPQELSDTINVIKSSGVKALFAEPQYSASSADVIARESGAKVYFLDPVVTGQADSSAADAYIKAMEKNKATICEALQ